MIAGTGGHAVADSDELQREVDRNFEAFQKILPELLQSHSGKFALLRHEEVVEFFDSAGDAMIFGTREYPDGLFSVQQVKEEIADLGYFSHALHHDPV